MSIDLTKLAPAPWHRYGRQIESLDEDENDFSGMVIYDEGGHSEVDAEFIVLARNAFDGDPEALAWWEANRVKRTTTA